MTSSENKHSRRGEDWDRDDVNNRSKDNVEARKSPDFLLVKILLKLPYVAHYSHFTEKTAQKENKQSINYFLRDNTKNLLLLFLWFC
jgi:hypothetical protein